MARFFRLFVVALCALSILSRSDGAMSPGETALRQAVALANFKLTTETLVIAEDINITMPLPAVKAGAGLILKGNCKIRGVYPVRCVIDAQGKYSLFTGDFNCRVTLEYLTVQNVNGNVFKGACDFTARGIVFQHNTGPRGPVLDSTGYWSPGTGLFSNCVFSSNTATASNGGAIAVGTGPAGSPLQVSGYSMFRDNRALKGTGGAIYAEGSSVFLKGVTFLRNIALYGGAVSTLISNTLIISNQFTANKALSGKGGAVFINYAGYSNEKLQVCSTTFTNNTAPVRFAASANVLVFSNFSGQTDALFCPKIPPGYQSRGNVRTQVWCRGCTGCAGDCNKNGVCTYDRDGLPYCQCLNHYDGNTACTACQTGYTPRSKCANCTGGFYHPTRYPSSCTTCPGLAQISFANKAGTVADITSQIWSATTVTSAAQCANICHATQACAYSEFSAPSTTNTLQCRGKMYCNMWAYIWPTRKAPAACSGMCIQMWNDLDCGIDPLVSNASLAITWQLDEKSLRFCS